MPLDDPSANRQAYACAGGIGPTDQPTENLEDLLGMLLIKPDPIVRNHNPAHRLACDVFESDRNRNHLGDVLTNMLESLAGSPP